MTASPTTTPAASDELTLLNGTRTTVRDQRRRAFAWQLYDVGNSAFQAVVVTFVFATYLASDLFLDPAVVAIGDANPQDPAYLAAQAGSQQVMSGFDTVAALLVAILAPALGRVTDGSGRRKRLLAIFSGLTIACMLAMFFVFPEARFLAIGAFLLAAGQVLSELAGVSYNAMLSQVATRENVGRVSGTGWGLGYIASIVLLLVVLVLFIQDFNGDAPGAGLLAVPTGTDGAAMNIRLTVLVSALWFLGFLIPILRRVPESPRHDAKDRVTFLGAYRALGRTIAHLWRTDRPLLQFLLASAVFRDGLNAVFAWGAVLAAQVYGFSSSEVLYFAVVANLVAGVGTLVAGWLDDALGPKRVILGSLVCLLVAGLAMMFVPDTKLAFWVLASILCLFVGPVQTASRTYLSRSVPEGREGELFGLYATTGRAAGWMSNVLYFVFISALAYPKAGVWGILIVFALGFALMLTVPAKPKVADLG